MPDQNCVVLVDFSNTGVARGASRPNPRWLGLRLGAFLTDTAALLADTFQSRFLDTTFRLYDGWFDDTGRGSDRFEMVRKHLRDYPTRTRRYRIRVEIASASLAAPEYPLHHTYRLSSGFPPSSLRAVSTQPDRCGSPSSCEIPKLATWLRGSCPGTPACVIRATETLAFAQQKLVDTHLATDLAIAAQRFNAVCALSDDEDVIPGLLAATTSRATRVLWLTRSSSARKPYAAVIGASRVELVQCQF